MTIIRILGFIESSMPRMFCDKKVINYDTEKENILSLIMRKQKKSHEEYAHFVFDQYCFEIHDYYKNQVGRNEDEIAINTLDQNESNLIERFIGDENFEVNVTWNGQRVGIIEVSTSLQDDYKKYAGQLIRLHKAIKRCRNMINHATYGRRPTTEQIEKGIKTYIRLAEIVFGENTSKERESCFEGRTRLCDNYDTATDNREVTFTAQKIGINQRNRRRLEGVLSNGDKAIIPFGNIDLSTYIGRTVKVRVVNDHGGTGSKECEIVEEV